MSFAQLKKNRAQALQKLSTELQTVDKTGFEDPNKGKYWTITRDSTTGNGNAIIRFLMGNPLSDDDPSYVKYWDHAFKGPT